MFMKAVLCVLLCMFVGASQLTQPENFGCTFNKVTYIADCSLNISGGWERTKWNTKELKTPGFWAKPSSGYIMTMRSHNVNVSTSGRLEFTLPGNTKFCMSFRYVFNNPIADQQSLAVLRDNTELFANTNDTRKTWQRVYVEIPPSTTTAKLIFNGHVEWGYDSWIGLDDVSITQCNDVDKEALGCDFDKGVCQGWVMKPMWKLARFPWGTEGKGCVQLHSAINYLNHWVPGTGTLTSPELPPDQDYCMAFRYSMQFTNGRVDLHIYVSTGSSRKKIATLPSKNMFQWERKVIHIPRTNTTSKVTFDATADSAVLMIDDVTFVDCDIGGKEPGLN